MNEWLRHFRRKESPEGGRVQIWFVNAKDVGYRYAGLESVSQRPDSRSVPTDTGRLSTEQRHAVEPPVLSPRSAHV